MINDAIQLLNKTWEESQLKANKNTRLPKTAFKEIINSIISTGTFYYYIVDFFDMSISDVSPSIRQIHGFHPKKVTFQDIIATIHPDDMPFVANCEKSIIDFFYNKNSPDLLTSYKVNYSFRSKMKNGEYQLLNHQALILSLDEEGKFGKSLNIHTCIEHLSTANTYKYSLIGLNGKPSYMNQSVNCDIDELMKFSPREIEIIKMTADGLNNNQIAIRLDLSAETVKKHRKNVLKKTNCANTPQLVKKCMELGFL